MPISHSALSVIADTKLLIAPAFAGRRAVHAGRAQRVRVRHHEQGVRGTERDRDRAAEASRVNVHGETSVDGAGTSGQHGGNSRHAASPCEVDSVGVDVRGRAVDDVTAGAPRPAAAGPAQSLSSAVRAAATCVRVGDVPRVATKGFGYAEREVQR